jgi:hypothetical protein
MLALSPSIIIPPVQLAEIIIFLPVIQNIEESIHLDLR